MRRLILCATHPWTRIGSFLLNGKEFSSKFKLVLVGTRLIQIGGSVRPWRLRAAPPNKGRFMQKQYDGKERVEDQ